MEGHIPQANRKAEHMCVSISDLSMLEQRRLLSRQDFFSASPYRVSPRPASLSIGPISALFLSKDTHDNCMRFQQSFLECRPRIGRFSAIM